MHRPPGRRARASRAAAPTGAAAPHAAAVPRWSIGTPGLGVLGRQRAEAQLRVSAECAVVLQSDGARAGGKWRGRAQRRASLVLACLGAAAAVQPQRKPQSTGRLLGQRETRETRARQELEVAFRAPARTAPARASCAPRHRGASCACARRPAALASGIPAVSCAASGRNGSGATGWGSTSAAQAAPPRCRRRRTTGSTSIGEIVTATSSSAGRYARVTTRASAACPSAASRARLPGRRPRAPRIPRAARASAAVSAARRRLGRARPASRALRAPRRSARTSARGEPLPSPKRCRGAAQQRLELARRGLSSRGASCRAPRSARSVQGRQHRAAAAAVRVRCALRPRAAPVRRREPAAEGLDLERARRREARGAQRPGAGNGCEASGSPPSMPTSVRALPAGRGRAGIEASANQVRQALALRRGAPEA